MPLYEKEIKDNWETKGATFGDDAGLMVIALAEMFKDLNNCLITIKEAIRGITTDPAVAKSVNALAQKMPSKAPQIVLEPPDMAPIAKGMDRAEKRHREAMATLEALLRILAEPGKEKPPVEWEMTFDRNASTDKIQKVILRPRKK
jgi:hypothetical protein